MCGIMTLQGKALMPEPLRRKTMKKSVLATLALAGSSMMFGAPQTPPTKPTDQSAAKTESRKTQKKRRHKKQAKNQVKNQQTQTPQQK